MKNEFPFPVKHQNNILDSRFQKEVFCLSEDDLKLQDAQMRNQYLENITSQIYACTSVRKAIESLEKNRSLPQSNIVLSGIRM